jgi:hypothetical protein
MRRDEYWIVEEVPGVPREEAYFVTGPLFGAPYPHFSSKVDAEKFLILRGITDYKFEPFVP